jgi:hypothetical protein
MSAPAAISFWRAEKTFKHSTVMWSRCDLPTRRLIGLAANSGWRERCSGLDGPANPRALIRAALDSLSGVEGIATFCDLAMAKAIDPDAAKSAPDPSGVIDLSTVDDASRVAFRVFRARLRAARQVGNIPAESALSAAEFRCPCSVLACD